MKWLNERKMHFILLAFLLGLFLGINMSYSLSADEPAHRYLDYFHRVYQIIRTDYVDKSNTRDIFYGAIRGMIKSLKDPFSRFLDESAFSNLKEETTGEFVGVGIQITVRDGKVVVISPIEDTPAMEAGIVSGDEIISIDGKGVRNKDINDIVKMIRGIPGTSVRIGIKRKDFNEVIHFDLERAKIKVKSVEFDTIKDTNVAYMKIKVFSSDTVNEVKKALKSISDKGQKKMIIDLRWNPGGLLYRAINISDLFLDKGKTIVSIRGRDGKSNVQEHKAVNPAMFDGQLIVLVNRGSASASEIFSGAIKDNGRGKLLGEKTFGKGSVQKFFNLDEKVGVTITIAKYYTPSGKSIHQKGIVPDYIVPMNVFLDNDRRNIDKILRMKLPEKFVKDNKVYNNETIEKFSKYLNENKLSISGQSAQYILKRELRKYSKQNLYDLEFDMQLNRAIDLLNGK